MLSTILEIFENNGVSSPEEMMAFLVEAIETSDDCDRILINLVTSLEEFADNE
jgi:hypothetical protein